MTLPESVTKEEFFKQVWVEFHPTYRSCLLFQNADPYFIYNHKEHKWFADDGTLFDNYIAPNVINSLTDEGYTVVIAPDVEEFLADSFANMYDVAPPFKDGVKMFNFQSFNIRKHLREPSGLCTADTGTGKTVVGIAMAVERLRNGDVDHVIVWGKSHLTVGWLQAINKFTHIEAQRVDKGSPKKREQVYAESTANVWATNYEKVRLDDYFQMRDALKGKRVMFVFDEIQKLKNRKSALHKFMAKAVKEMKVEYMLGLSATPVETSPVDFYNIMRIIEPSLYGTVKEFEAMYTYQYGMKDKYGNYIAYQNLQDFRLKAAHIVTTARKSTPEIAAEFPKMWEITIPLELSPEDERLYRRIMEMAKAQRFSAKPNKPRWADAARRVCSLPESLLLMPDGDNFTVATDVAGVEGISTSKHCAKLSATLDLVRDITAQGDKVIVFYSLTNHGIIPLAKHFEEFNPLLYYGGMNVTQKDEALQLFKTSSAHNLIFISEAGREGLNIPEAGYLIHYNTPYIWSHYEQRSNRIHRIDSTKDKVVVYRFLTAGTIEERVEETMFERKGYAQDVGVSDETIDTMSQGDEEYILFGRD